MKRWTFKGLEAAIFWEASCNFASTSRRKQLWEFLNPQHRRDLLYSLSPTCRPVFANIVVNVAFQALKPTLFPATVLSVPINNGYSLRPRVILKDNTWFSLVNGQASQSIVWNSTQPGWMNRYSFEDIFYWWEQWYDLGIKYKKRAKWNSRC